MTKLNLILIFLFLFNSIHTLNDCSNDLIYSSNSDFCCSGVSFCSKSSSNPSECSGCDPLLFSLLNPTIAQTTPTQSLAFLFSNENYLMIIDGFLNGIHFNEKCPELKKTFMTIIKFIPEINDIYNNIKNMKDMNNLLPFIFKIYYTFESKLKEIISQSKEIPQESQALFKSIFEKVSQPVYFSSIYENAEKKLLEIVIEAVAVKNTYKAEKYDECGSKIGKIAAIILQIE